MTRRFKQVDVFTDTLGLGNPVAVVLDAEGLSSDDMARFANWTNLSETTFVLPPTEPDADYHVRIFTPTQELPFAGHPTIGTCHAWLEAGGQPKNDSQIVQQCGAGLVTLRAIDGRLAFETPPCVQTGSVDAELRHEVIANLGISAEQVIDMAWAQNGPPWVGVLVDTVDTLRSIQPSAIHEAAWPGVAALTGELAAGDAAVEVRAFFDNNGVCEDPVTGSLNGSLAQWLVGTGALTTPYVSSQGTSMGRNGRVYVNQADDGGLWIGGDAVTGIDGTVVVGPQE